MRKKLNINEHLDTSFEDAWASFIISQTAKGISETTLRNYRTHLRAISKHLNISASLSDLSKSDLEAMIVSMRGSGLAHNTIATYLRCVNTFLNWCRLEGLADLSIPNIAEKETVKETYTDAELALLLKKPAKSADFCEYRNWVIINFLLNIAMYLAAALSSGFSLTLMMILFGALRAGFLPILTLLDAR